MVVLRALLASTPFWIHTAAMEAKLSKHRLRCVTQNEPRFAAVIRENMDKAKIVQELSSKKLKAEKFNLTEVKTMLDDAIRKVMNDGAQFKESHVHMDTKLIIGFPAALVAGSVALYNYFVPFEKCREIIAVGVVIYFILNSLFMWYIWRVERDTIYIGNKGTQKIILASKLKGHDPNYLLKMEQINFDTPKEPVGKKAEMSRSIARWLDVQGNLVPQMLVNDLSEFIEGNLKKK